MMKDDDWKLASWLRRLVALLPVLFHIGIVASFSGCQTPAGSGQVAAEQRAKWPKTVDEAVDRLMTELNQADLRAVRVRTENDLIDFHMSLGLYIRNSYGLWQGNKALLKSAGSGHPDDASYVIITGLWHKLNSRMTATERASVAAKRAVVARKYRSYDKLEAECASQLTKVRGELEECYRRHGVPLPEHPGLFEPYFALYVGKSGHVRKIDFYRGTAPALKACLEKKIKAFTFSRFSDDESVMIYIQNFPNCRVAERDEVYK